MKSQAKAPSKVRVDGETRVMKRERGGENFPTVQLRYFLCDEANGQESHQRGSNKEIYNVNELVHCDLQPMVEFT